MTDKLPLVSILIPCYNAEPFLAETLDSCLNQTWQNFEIIIVDDHSKDDSFRILEHYRSRFPEIIKIFKNSKKGACAARNFALEKSSGDYIQYLDADDLLNSEKIKSQINLLCDNKKGTIAHCQWGKFISDIIQTNWKEQKINKDYDNSINWLIDSWNGLGMAQTSVWLTPRFLIKKVGGWDENLLINQDGEFFSRVILGATAIIFCEEAKVYYRSGNPLSISQSKSGNFHKVSSLLMSYELYQNNILQHDSSDAVRRALGNNYLNFIYQFKKKFPDLAIKAEKKFKELGLGKMWPVGGANFQRIARILGFKNALKFKALLG